MAGDPEAEAVEIAVLLEAINARYGYDLRGYAPDSMRRRVPAALTRTGLPHLGELQHRLVHDPAFFGGILRDLTVRTSELFRDPATFRVFRERVVPVLRTYPLIRIWHGGCANGEEIYSMAILLTEEGLYDRAQIYATDLNPEALEEAKQGVYSSRQLPKAQENYRCAGGRQVLDDYLTEAFGRVAVRDSLRRNVFFFQHDLVSDQVFGEMHVVFCRNVLIYFGPELKARALAKLKGSLCPGGFLTLGESEQLDPRNDDPGFTRLDPTARIYRHEP
jgi:chemotaxis protein methyltransferase CheR